MILGNQVEWALHCMTVLAGLPAGVAVPAKVLAEFHDVPKEYLSKSLQLLSNANLVITTLGPRGGYQLARPPEQISFLDIVEAVEGKKNTFHCSEIRRNNPCLSSAEKKMTSTCQIAAVMFKADESWREVLRQKKLSDVRAELAKKLDPEVQRKTTEWFEDKLTP